MINEPEMDEPMLNAPMLPDDSGDRMSHTLRLFIGLDATTLAAPLQQLQQQWGAIGKPVAAGNFHLTVHFLGAVDSQRLPDLQRLITHCWQAQQWQGCSLWLDQAGAFARARVAWLGPKTLPAQLQQLEQDLRTALLEGSWTLEVRPFRPHVTLFRALARDWIPPATVPALPLTLDALHLYESRSTPQGVQYLSLSRWPLH